MMDEKYLSTLNHDLSFRPGVIREALAKGVKFGTKEFFVYSQLRWYETDGKFGFCVAGLERLGEDVGLSADEVEYALRGLKDAGLVEHVWCDKKVYRNKTKIWISSVRLAGVCTNVEAIRVLDKGAKNKAFLGKTTFGNVETTFGNVETTSGNVETTSGNVGASPVTTGVGNTNRNTKEIRKSLVANATTNLRMSSADASDDIKEELNHSFPFDEEVIKPMSLKPTPRNNENAVAGALVNDLCKLLGADSRGQNVAVRNVKTLMNKGYTREEIKGMVEWTMKDEFYKEKPLHTRLGNDAMQQYLMAKSKEQSSNGKSNDNPEFEVVW